MNYITMVLTAAQTTAFFRDADQMGIPQATVAQLQIEVITTIADLADFEKETLQQMADNLRKPGGWVPDPNPAAATGATIPTPPFVFGAKSHHRLTMACELVHYYNTIGRDLSAGNMRWSNVMKNFEIQWKALKERKEAHDPDIPKICKSVPIMKWTEAFQDYLHRTIGVRTIPLAYITRETVDVPAMPLRKKQISPTLQSMAPLRLNSSPERLMIMNSTKKTTGLSTTIWRWRLVEPYILLPLSRSNVERMDVERGLHSRVNMLGIINGRPN